MTPYELMADLIHRTAKFTKDTLANFPDADMLVRSCPDDLHSHA
jgi:hypothetical protein